MRIAHSSWHGSRDIEHVGSSHDEAELEMLMAAAGAAYGSVTAAHG